MGWDYVATLWYKSYDKYKLSSTSKDSAEDIGNNVYITMYKYLEFTVLESISTVTLCQFPEKSMSVNTSNDLF